jgi:hypothetical protein
MYLFLLRDVHGVMAGHQRTTTYNTTGKERKMPAHDNQHQTFRR